MAIKKNPQAARRQILDAAVQAFAALGPAGARIDAIAAEARVNKRMLYHYFGDKEALFAAVLDDRLGADPMLPRAASALAGGLPLEVGDLRLMVWAAIGGFELGAEHARGWQRLIAELVDEQGAGRLRNDVDAGLIALVLIAVSALPRLLPEHARLVGAGDGLPWSGLRTLMQPREAQADTIPRGNRPRVRMLPEVRDR